MHLLRLPAKAKGWIPRPQKRQLLQPPPRMSVLQERFNERMRDHKPAHWFSKKRWRTRPSIRTRSNRHHKACEKRPVPMQDIEALVSGVEKTVFNSLGAGGHLQGDRRAGDERAQGAGRRGICALCIRLQGVQGRGYVYAGTAAFARRKVE